MNIRNPFSPKASASVNNQHAQQDSDRDPLHYPICGVWESQTGIGDVSLLTLLKWMLGRR